jgi:hypothetical protein
MAYKRACIECRRSRYLDTLKIANNLASLFKEQGKLDEANLLCELVLSTRERLLGPHHPDTLRIVNNLATLSSKINWMKPSDLMRVHFVHKSVNWPR